jgi:hypothetical protein
VQYDNANHIEEDQRMHFEGPSRYPEIATWPDQLLQRLQGMQTEMEVLKERNRELEDLVCKIQSYFKSWLQWVEWH